MPDAPDKTVKKLFEIVTNRRFRRSQFPDGDDKAIIEIIENALSDGAPIRFMHYWGKTDRAVPGLPEEMAVDFLAQHLGKLADNYEPGIELTTILADTHIAFNGYDLPVDFQGKLEELLQERLSRKSVDNNNIIRKENIKTEVVLMSEVAGYTKDSNYPFAEFEFFESTGLTFGNFLHLPETIMKEIEKQAQKHYKREQEHTADEVALMYLAMNAFEKQRIGKSSQLGGAIFLTYAHPSRAPFLPSPILPTYSIHKGQTQPPWFMDPEILEERVLSHGPLVGALRREDPDDPERTKSARGTA